MNADFVIMGLPASGKTTFLAALWHLVEAGEVDCRLKLAEFEGDLVYLNKIAEAWRTFQKVPRTSQVGDVDVTMRLMDSETGATAIAFFPDLAGETFEAQVAQRRVRPTFVEHVSKDSGLMLFLSANVTSGDAMSVVELNAMLPPEPDSGEQSTGGDVVNEQGETHALPEWTQAQVPTQVQLVQLLSDFLRGPFYARKRRLAVIISAWDLVVAMKLSPEKWLDAHMPLLSQFLKTNGASFEPQIYGISAQGVNLEDGPAVQSAARLLPSRRIQVVSPDGPGNDLTLPLVWLMSSE